MREPQVCNHCGGRFGLVTHRWWSNKFCKRACKDAYLHEVALGRDKRWSRFAGQFGGLAKVDSGFDYAANFSSFACLA
jgi:hypothetical protein